MRVAIASVSSAIATLRSVLFPRLASDGAVAGSAHDMAGSKNASTASLTQPWKSKNPMVTPVSSASIIRLVIMPHPSHSSPFEPPAGPAHDRSAGFDI